MPARFYNQNYTHNTGAMAALVATRTGQMHTF
jgi:hypothetical protein